MSWQFVVRPKWIVRHVAVVLLVVSMVLLGFWQLRRLDEKRDLKATVEARQEEPAADVQEVVPAGAAVGDAAVEAVEHRSVTATGTYADDDTFVVENRTFNGASGAWVLTPLVLDDGSAVVVNRGFLGFDRDGRDRPAARTRGRGGGRWTAPRERAARAVRRIRPRRGHARGAGAASTWRASPSRSTTTCCRPTSSSSAATPEEVTPEGAPELVPLGRPELSEGPHLAYAVQWFTFTTIAVVGYALLLRRVARDEAREEAGRAADAAFNRELEELLDAEA